MTQQSRDETRPPTPSQASRASPSSPSPPSPLPNEARPLSPPPARRGKRTRCPSPSVISDADSDSIPTPSPKKTKRRGKRSAAKAKTVKLYGRMKDTIVQIGDHNSVSTIPGRGLPAVQPATSASADISIIDSSEVDASTIPQLLEPPAEFTEAVALVKSKECPSNTHEADVQFFYDYVSTALRHIGYSGRKLNCLWWIPELKEGWYDSSLWCHIIDALCARSIYVTVLRKEIQIIPRGSTDRFDGVFRWMNGMNERFDLGVIEVGSMSQLPNSDSKPATDRAKIIRGMATLLGEARKLKQDPKLQVIGMLCSGWSITLFRMWHNGTACVVEDRKFTVWTMEEHVSRNIEVFKVVVQSLEILTQTAHILMDS